MSFHVDMSQKQLDDKYTKEEFYNIKATEFLEDWQYRHLSWRIHKFSKVCPICLSIRINREMVETYILAKSHSLGEDDRMEDSGEPAEFELHNDDFIDDMKPSEDIPDEF